MKALLASRRPGVVVLRRAWAESTGKAASAGNAVHQTLYRVLRIAFEPQKRLYDDAGRLCGVADIYVPGLREAHVVDGEVDRAKVQPPNGLDRDPDLGRIGVRRRDFTLDDLLHHAALLMHELDRDLGRPHRPQLLHRWRAMVEQSLYSAAGQERMVNRWHREMGVSEWSRSA